MVFFRIIVGTALLAGAAHASPFDDLASESQQIRMQAAQTIRENHLYHATSRAKWDKLAATFKLGDSAARLIGRLHAHDVALELKSSEIVGAGVYHIPLDDSWTLVVAINNGFMTDYEIDEEPRVVFVPPPEGFSGEWRTYRLNGEPSGSATYYSRGIASILGD